MFICDAVNAQTAQTVMINLLYLYTQCSHPCWKCSKCLVLFNRGDYIYVCYKKTLDTSTGLLVQNGKCEMACCTGRKFIESKLNRLSKAT